MILFLKMCFFKFRRKSTVSFCCQLYMDSLVVTDAKFCYQSNSVALKLRIRFFVIRPVCNIEFFFGFIIDNTNRFPIRSLSFIELVTIIFLASSGYTRNIQLARSGERISCTKQKTSRRRFFISQLKISCGYPAARSFSPARRWPSSGPGRAQAWPAAERWGHRNGQHPGWGELR